MRSMIRSIVFASAALCATAAFAADKASINVPFSFDSHGKHFSAGRYEVALDMQHNTVTLQNMTDGRQSMFSAVTPTDDDSFVRLVFNANEDTHTLQSIQIGPREATHIDRTRHHKGTNEMASSDNVVTLTAGE